MGTRRGIPEATVARLPVYHRVLTSLNEVGVATVSSEELANASGVSSAKLRKDLSHLGSYGTRGVGYDVEFLVYQIARELGLTQDWPVVIVGVGNLGRALANYGGFASRGFRIVGGAGQDQRRARLVNEHAVRFVNDGEGEAAQRQTGGARWPRQGECCGESGARERAPQKRLALLGGLLGGLLDNLLHGLLRGLLDNLLRSLLRSLLRH